MSHSAPTHSPKHRPLQPGERAPAFTLPTAGGGRVKLSDFKGKRVVLYFYPKDNTPACTAEALSFAEKTTEFAHANTVVIGVSRDSVASHDKFAAKYGLQLLLASDEDGSVCQTYGVWTEKKLYGRNFMGIERSTFLIDEAGRIKSIWRKVRVKEHVDKVLTEIAAL